MTDKLKYEPRGKDCSIAFPLGGREMPKMEKGEIVFAEHGYFHVWGPGLYEAVNQHGKVLGSGRDLGFHCMAAKGDRVTIHRLALTRDPFTAAEIKKARKPTTVEVVEHMPYGGPIYFGSKYEDGSLNKMIASLEKVRKTIPKPYRDKARCEFHTHMEYGETYIHVTMSYSRPETDAEVLHRLEIEGIEAALAERSKRAQLARLQKELAA